MKCFPKELSHVILRKIGQMSDHFQLNKLSVNVSSVPLVPTYYGSVAMLVALKCIMLLIVVSVFLVIGMNASLLYR